MTSKLFKNYFSKIKSELRHKWETHAFRNTESTCTFCLIPPLSNVNIIDCKWIYINYTKLILWPRDFINLFGIDCTKTFKFVVEVTTIYTKLDLALSWNWHIFQLNSHYNFLNGLVGEDGYRTQPQGFVHP